MSSCIQRRLLATSEYRDADAIVLYASKGREVATDALFDAAIASGRAVFYPRIEADADDSSITSIVVRRDADRVRVQPGPVGIHETTPRGKNLHRQKLSQILFCPPGVA